ncbi:unnamed protein product [Urochloa humidicola]
MHDTILPFHQRDEWTIPAHPIAWCAICQYNMLASTLPKRCNCYLLSVTDYNGASSPPERLNHFTERGRTSMLFIWFFICFPCFYTTIADLKYTSYNFYLEAEVGARANGL